MKLSCHTDVFYKLSLQEAVGHISKAGFRNVDIGTGLEEFFCHHIITDRATDADLEATRGWLKELGIGVASLSAAGVGPGLTESAKRGADIAVALGAETVVIGLRGKKGDALEPFVEPLKELERYAKGKGLKIAIENHRNNVVENLREALEIMELAGSERVGLCLDTGHFCISNVDSLEAARRLGRYAFTTHVKDMKGYEVVPLGEGEANIERFVREMKGQAYGGWYGVEMEIEENPMQALVKARQFMETLLS